MLCLAQSRRKGLSQHLIKYFDDPISPNPKELEFEFAPSFDEAFTRASRRAVELRKQHGDAAGFKIEDMTGRTVMIGPGRMRDA